MEEPKTADEWLEEIHNEFNHESDRSAAIVATAMIDRVLYLLIEKHLVSHFEKGHSLLSGQNPPLGSFSNRIDAAFQFGLISRYLCRDLHLIRKIRNEFAHRPLRCTFETTPIKEWVSTLEKASDYNRRYPDTRAAIGPPGNRWDFLCIIAWILYALSCEIESTEPICKHGPEFGYIDWESLPDEVKQALKEAST